MNIEQKKNSGIQQNQKAFQDVQEAFTLSRLKEELEKLKDTEFMMFIPLGGKTYGR